MEEIKEYLYVMDYSDGTISEIQLTEKQDNDDIDTILDKYHMKADNCSWMFTESRIESITKLSD